MDDVLDVLDVALVRAPNPGPLTLSGTNSWVAGRDPAWVIDPGPAIDEHLDRLAAEVAERGGAGGIAVTHKHGDHADGVAGLLERLARPVPVGAAATGSRRLRDRDPFGPLEALSLPGHSADHLVYAWSRPAGRVCFTGDAVLGAGSVFVSSDMEGYLRGLRRLQALDCMALLPGHGPVVREPRAHLRRYLTHRLEREKRLVEALAAGLREETELLDRVWSDVPEELREAARLTLRAHLEKLRAEGRPL